MKKYVKVFEDFNKSTPILNLNIDPNEYPDNSEFEPRIAQELGNVVEYKNEGSLFTATFTDGNTISVDLDKDFEIKVNGTLVNNDVKDDLVIIYEENNSIIEGLNAVRKFLFEK